MRQVMPHRNNMSLHRNKCKIFLRGRTVIAGTATILQQRAQTRKIVHVKNRIGNNSLRVV
jgi:hypothetical protein